MRVSAGKKLIILGIVLVVIDQVIKVLVKTNMQIGEQFNVLGSWFRILFIENDGMAFGMSFGGVAGKYVLTTFRICLFAAIWWWVSKLLKRGDSVPAGVPVGLTLIAAGAMGNIIDCLFYGLVFEPHLPFMQGKVVDMFYFPLIDTYIGGHHITFFDPVFNFADSCVTVGAFYLILFQWKFFTKSEHAEDQSLAKKH